MLTSFGKWLFGLALLLALPVAAQESEASAQVAATGSGKILTVAVRPEFSPYAFRDENGVSIGFDIDLLKGIAEVQGLQVRFIVTSAEGLLDAVADGLYDIGASGIPRTPELEEKFLYSEPVARFAYTLVTREDSGITGFAGLAGKRVAVLTDAVQRSVLDEYLGGARATIVEHPTMYFALNEVFEGSVDAVFGASTLLRFHAGLRDHRYLNTKLRFITFESDEKNFYTYLVVRKGREELMDTLNEGLRKLQASGRYHTISQDWFAN